MTYLNTHLPLFKDDANTVEKVISKIRYDTHENVYILKNGEQVWRFRGETDRVTIDNIYLVNMIDASIIHNHPGGFSFSKEDVEAIIRYNAKELILVTQEYIYSITRPKNGWNINFDDPQIDVLYNTCQFLARTALDKKAHELLFNEREIKLIHYIWDIFFRELGISYVQKKHI
ncbi:hypothetical protein QNI16_34955 [Cytophagaceae bacterium YF14B1]|uniref:Uncharacterized protein n=1 Tax=Xanthocytophaga flava TaxID=3048013 RepID=A0AAE3UCQ1_9BACT|nr:hypothetical protein [Xanthocytophaga flavus]MDJ1485733.1 hypothetical protein [Xanthocytophaga flavus]